jgi:hypothetical protein
VIQQNRTLITQGAHLTANFHAKTPVEKYGILNKEQNMCFNIVWKLPGSDVVHKLLSTVDNFKFGDEIIYRQRVTADHSALTITVVLSEEFILHHRLRQHTVL